MAAWREREGAFDTDAWEQRLDVEGVPLVDIETTRVRAWNLEQLRRLGVDDVAAGLATDAGINWHDIDSLVKVGCPLERALEIAA